MVLPDVVIHRRPPAFRLCTPSSAYLERVRALSCLCVDVQVWWRWLIDGFGGDDGTDNTVRSPLTESLQHPRSRVLLLPYFVILGLGVSGSIYGMCRMAAVRFPASLLRSIRNTLLMTFGVFAGQEDFLLDSSFRRRVNSFCGAEWGGMYRMNSRVIQPRFIGGHYRYSRIPQIPICSRIGMEGSVLAGCRTKLKLVGN